MSADGDIVRQAIMAPGRAYGTSAPLAALARLEAAEARLGIAEEQLEAASEECREWQDAARSWQDNYKAAEAKSRDLMSALDALSGEPAMLDRLREAEAQRDDLQARADAIYAADRAQEQNIEEARQSHAMTAEAQRDALAEALRTICNIGETRDVEVARSALADAGLIADSDTTTVFKS